VIGLARLSNNQLVAGVAGGYVAIVRNVPLLLQLFYWYFAVLRPLPNPRQSLNVLDIAFLNKRGLFLPSPLFQPGFGTFALTALAMLIAALCLWRINRRRRVRTGAPLFHPTALLLLLLPPLAIAWAYDF